MLTMQDHLSTATAEVLRDLARNEAADRAWRKASVKKLIEMNHPYMNHTDFRELRIEIREEEEATHEVESLIAQVAEKVQIPDNLPTSKVIEGIGPLKPNLKEGEPTGPFKASFTTKDM